MIKPKIDTANIIIIIYVAIVIWSILTVRRPINGGILKVLSNALK